MFLTACETMLLEQRSNYEGVGAVSANQPNIRLPITKSFLGIKTT